jgi:hypothetical protein
MKTACPSTTHRGDEEEMVMTIDKHHNDAADEGAESPEEGEAAEAAAEDAVVEGSTNNDD